ncbi:condensin subunit ScpA [Granulicella pectinivorans]|jgi:segregation and condensation protein A|uniref:Segregation and condensation protein A n=1 Tax=Granulicella pectinivorans TaxID=474950 RepID=A0A1I6L9F8_9BACT|nr:segregation/condensation protein A [Granulicella pectinivorans]SFS00089.1 condensin subunit ScpA [Granulicella pectinivorans]
MSEETLQSEEPTAEGSVPEVEAEVPHPPFALASKPTPPAPEPKRTPAARDKDKEKEEASLSPFSVQVGQVYDGPLDLLLDLIRKQNIDIYDIPIARITSQFLDYTHQLKQTDVDSAGEFIYMASLLIHIKSKTLLPRDPSDVTGADAEDPRRELVERLLEHERFKAAAQMLQQKQQIEEATWSNPGLRYFRREQEAAQIGGMEQEIAADTSDLIRVFRDILERIRTRPILNVDEESVTVAQMITYVKQRLLLEDKPVSLRRLLHNTHTERALICMFLAMLELVRLQAVLLHQPVIQGDILIKKTDNFEDLIADQSVTRDDWR